MISYFGNNTKYMRATFTFLLTLIIFTSGFLKPLDASAYYFATDIETKILSLSDEKIVVEVTQHDNRSEEEVFPIGTKMFGDIFAHKGRRHFLRDEYVKFHLYKAELPNGETQELDHEIKLRPRVLFNGQHVGDGIVAATALVLKVTVAVWSVGFPVGRGGKAIWDAGAAAFNTPTEESKWAHGAKGFVKGIFFPLPELFLKGEKLAVHEESYIWIQDAKQKKKKLSAFLIKRKNQYSKKDAYYEATGKVKPEFVNRKFQKAS